MDFNFENTLSSCLHTPQSTFCFLFFTFTAMFCLFSLLLFLLRLVQAYTCSCEICTAYVSSSWTKDFDNLCDWYTHLLRKSPTNTIHIHVLGNIVTANPDNVEHMLRTKFDNYPKGKAFSSLLGDLLGRGIFNVDGDSWRFQRKMASLELGSVSVRSHAFDIVTSEIKNRLLPLLSSKARKETNEKEIIDLQDVFRRFSFDTICKFSFGLDPGCLRFSLPMSEFAMAFDTASMLCAKRGLCVSHVVWQGKRLLNLGSEKKLKEAIKVINVLAEEVIRQRRTTSGFTNRNDLLSRFMGSISDDKYLRDIVVSFLLAGRDTVASALTGFFWLLSNHPKVEESIREELDRVMHPTQDVATFEQMQQMHYLHAAVCESMRLFPPVQFDSKFSQADDILPDGTRVTKGTRVTYHPYAMGRMENIWGPDRLEFKPERWLKNGVFVPISAYKYPVFQGGLRVCLGKEMALVEMKSVALVLIRRFNVRVANPSHAPQFVPSLTATVRGGLPVFLQDKTTK